MALQSVKVTINGVDCNLTYNSTSSKWEGSTTAPTVTSYNVNGGHYYPVTVTATNTAGSSVSVNDTDATVGSSLKLQVKEKTPPTANITNPTAGAKVITAIPTISFQVRDEANGSGINLSSLTLKIDSGSNIVYNATGMTCTPVTNGYDCTYAVQSGSSLTDGSHTIYINVLDNDGNSATTATTTFVVDTVAPSLNITSPNNGLVTNSASLAIIGSTTDITSNPVTVTIKLNGVDQGSVPLTSGNFNKTITLASGSNTIIVRATDASGLFTDVTRTVTLDTSVPVVSAVTITPNPADGGATLVIKVTVTG